MQINRGDNMKKFITIVFLLITNLSFATIYYVDATNGSDSNNGTSSSTPWKTIDKVNTSTFAPGDSILFKRGESFRGNLVPCSGSPSGYITYSAYGTGNKPKLLGAYERSSPSDWTDQGENIWRAKYRTVNLIEPELFLNPDFSSDLSYWEKWDDPATGASTVFSRTTATGEYYTAPGGGKLVCINHGNDSSPWNTDIQLHTTTGPITARRWYCLSFMAKATQPFTVPAEKIKLHKPSSGTNYSSYSSTPVAITTTWTTCEIMFRASITSESDGCEITFYLGNVIPNGDTLYIDSFNFKECEEDPECLSMDVGNVYFNNETTWGVLVWNRSDLNAQGKFWYDVDNDLLEMYSAVNPGNFYSHIELSMDWDMISSVDKSYFICENLDIRYGGNGFQATNTHHTCVRNCDFSFMGGANITGEYPPGRGGNGATFWNENHDNVVEKCAFNQIYDAATSAQGVDNTGIEVYNLYFRNNVISNSEYSFEYWERENLTQAHNIYFENNTCINAGGGWGHSQRPDPNGTHVMIWANPAQTADVHIRNNIFYNAVDQGVRWHRLEDVNTVIMDHNCWYQLSGLLAKIILSDNIGILNITYNYATQWDAYRADTEQDFNSIHCDPVMTSDLTLQVNSPCIDAGITLSTVADDFNGTARPQGNAYDIGAFEAVAGSFVEPTLITTSDYLIYPNPTNGKLSIESKVPACFMTIFSIEGKPLVNIALHESVNSIDLSTLTSGIYIIKFENSSNVIIRKLIKQ